MIVNLISILRVQDLQNKFLTNIDSSNLTLSPVKIKEPPKDANFGIKNERPKQVLEVDDDEFKRQKTELPKINKNHLMPKKILNLSESRESSIERNSEAESKISTGNYNIEKINKMLTSCEI